MVRRGVQQSVVRAAVGRQSQRQPDSDIGVAAALRQRADRVLRESLMPARWRLISAAAFVVVVVSGALSAQWLDYPTPAVPRTRDGKPDMSAATPRAASGKPDLSGMWGWET